MEVIGGIASVSQLAVYTHTAWKIFTRLYAELKGGPAAWKEHITNLEYLIQITKRISCLSEKAQLCASGDIATIVQELQEIANNALKSIERTKEKILGVRWSAIGITELLKRTFESLKAKRELLLLVLSHENLIEIASISRGALSIPTNLADKKMIPSTPSKEIAHMELASKVEIEMTSKQMGNGSTMISNNGLGNILEHIQGSVKLSTSSAGDRAVVNSNNVYMDPDIIKMQLKIAEKYAQDFTEGQLIMKSPTSRVRAKSSGPRYEQRSIDAP